MSNKKRWLWWVALPWKIAGVGLILLLLFTIAQSFDFLGVSSSESQGELESALIEPFDSLGTRVKYFSLLGGHKVIGIENASKCNLWKGYFVLNRQDLDSADVAEYTHRLAHQLFLSRTPDRQCDSRLMVQAFVYLTTSDYINDQSEWLAMSSITPADYGGDTYVRKWKLHAKK